MTQRTQAATPHAILDSRLHLTLLLCFALSGATGIVYEVLWSRMLSLVFGSTTAATGVTLAVFMGGLALGGWQAGRRADGLGHPLRIYALLEGGVGLCALLVPLALENIAPLARLVWLETHGATGAMLLLRLAVAAVLLLPPTALMGATLPILGRFCADRADTLGARLGTLYGVNTLGAAAGAFLAGFVLISLFGVSGAVRTAAFVNIVLAATAWLLDRHTREESVEPDPPSPRMRGVLNTASPRMRGVRGVALSVKGRGQSVASYLVQIAFGISGALALVYEVAWTRALLMLIGSSMQAFAAMLTTFLAGLQLGALIAARFADRLRNPLVALAWLEASVGMAAWYGHRLFGSLPWIDLTLMDTPVLLARFGMAAAVMLPTAVCLGALFPLAVRACAPPLERVGRVVGDLYAGNTIGAIVGALLASFLLLPWIGAETTLRLAMAGNVILGLGLLVAATWFNKREPNPPTSAPGIEGGWFTPLLMALLLLLVLWPDPWDMILVTLAQTTRREAASYREIYHQLPWVSEADFVQQMHQDQELVSASDGRSSHVAVIRNRVNTSLLTNGHSDGSDNTDMATQVLLGALPMLMRPELPAQPRVAVLGWGTGVTAGVVEQFPIERLTGLELEPKVLQAADLFRHVNHASLRDPRARVVLEDGRCALLADPTTYDVIISEPSNVWQAGVCSLFTRDFFQICRARLRPGGLFAQWIGYGSIPPAELKGVLAALRRAFPGVLLFRVDVHDAVLVASARPFQPDAARLQARLQSASPALRADLDKALTPTSADIVSRLIAGPSELDTLIGGAEPNTDDNARLECAVSGVGGLRSYNEENGKALAAIRAADPCAYFDLAHLTGAEMADLRQQILQARAKPSAD